MQTPLHDASSRGHLKVVELLLKSGADKNIKNNVKNGSFYYSHHYFQVGKCAADMTSNNEIQNLIIFFVPIKKFKLQLKKIQTNKQLTSVKVIHNK